MTTNASMESFRVCVRLRGGASSDSCVTADEQSGRMTVRFPDATVRGPDASRSFAFDVVFSESASNATVFDAVVAPYVRSALDGYHAACFAYGATGSGKTYTMGGDVTRNVEGMSAMAIRTLCSQGSDVNLTASLVEVYNERVRDLGGDATVERRPTDIVESPSGVSVRGVVEHAIASLTALDTLLHVGAARRATAFTNSNHVSSRSHLVLTLKIHRREGGGAVRSSRLTFVDLAGSEKLAEALRRGDNVARRREGSTINKSLLALGYCLLLLSRGSAHIPYRDSILTRLLRDTLGGNTRTVMIATISPDAQSYDETLSTLKYASSARSITRSVCRNEAERGVLQPLNGNDDIVARPMSIDAEGEASRLKQHLRRLKLQLAVTQRCNDVLGLHVPVHSNPNPMEPERSPRPDAETVVSDMRRDVTRSIRSSERRLVSPRLSHARDYGA